MAGLGLLLSPPRGDQEMKPVSDSPFRLSTDLIPAGDQPTAIEALVQGVRQGLRHQVLLGVTGSGKTFTMANCIARLGRPALIMAPNKTLAAQLFGEFKALFPENAVEYFVSYYDYYQPEAYIPQSDTYIEKDSAINDFIDRLRHSATRSLLTRRDVIIVASVSCIYGLGSPEEYEHMNLYLRVGDQRARKEIITALVAMLYQRNDVDFHRGAFRVRGDVIDIFPAHEEDRALRVELFGDEIESLSYLEPVTGRRLGSLRDYLVYPSSHYVTSSSKMERAMGAIALELKERVGELRDQGRLLEAQRLEQRTMLDLEMLKELGFCHGIENYSRHLSGRMAGEPPPTLLDYFPRDFLLFVDESHITVPQIRGMYAGDRSRKETLVEYGFRLPSALDNRPLNFQEFEERVPQTVYVSATPGPYELQAAEGVVVEQVIRPTGLLDPRMEVRPASNQVDDLLEEVRKQVEQGRRVLVTTLTKRMAEDLTEFMASAGVRVEYLHSDIKTVERSRLVQGLRQGEFDVLVGINLLREGLDIPEVGLVAVLDADKEGFLRSDRSLIQTAGRAARNVDGLVILYADQITGSMRRAMEETRRRRKKQRGYNREHGIEPATVSKGLSDALSSLYDQSLPDAVAEEPRAQYLGSDALEERIAQLEARMKELARELKFEEAAQVRDRIKGLKAGLKE